MCDFVRNGGSEVVFKIFGEDIRVVADFSFLMADKKAISLVLNPIHACGPAFQIEADFKRFYFDAE